MAPLICSRPSFTSIRFFSDSDSKSALGGTTPAGTTETSFATRSGRLIAYFSAIQPPKELPISAARVTPSASSTLSSQETHAVVSKSNRFSSLFPGSPGMSSASTRKWAANGNTSPSQNAVLAQEPCKSTTAGAPLGPASNRNVLPCGVSTYRFSTGNWEMISLYRARTFSRPSAVLKTPIRIPPSLRLSKPR